MKTMLKRFLPCLLIVLAVFTIVSCDDEYEYKYPTEVPLYTESGNFVEIGNLKVTKKDLYNRLVQSYGIEVLENVIDAQLLADVTLTEDQKEEFANQITLLKYGTEDIDSLTEEEKTEALKAFESSMISDGLHTDSSKSDDPLYFENHYLLEFKRYVKALEVLEKEIEEYEAEAEENDEDPYFADDDYLSYFVSNFHKTYKLIIVTFDSEKEAKDAMAASDIDLTSLAGAWKSVTTNAEMTEAQIKDAFMNMYEKAYGKTCEGATTYTYDELYALSSATSKDGAIVNRALKLNSGDYTHGPLLYTNRWFVIYAEEVGTEYVNDDDDSIKFADSDEYIAEKDADNNVLEITDALKEALHKDLVKSSLVSDSTFYENTIDRVMFELRQAAGLEIFAEGLENTYRKNYESAYSALDITDYDAFKQTTNTSSTEVAKWNGDSLTVQEMFDALTNRYGALVTLLFVQHYVVLTSEHNTVINYATGEVLDQDAYNEYVEEDINAYKESFEEGNFESYGFPASYGWDNFLRDYIGLSQEAAIIVDFNSTLYNDVIALYTEALYMADVEDVDLSVLTDEDGNKTWALSSSKWTKTYNTGITVIDENVKPEITLAWDAEDVLGVIKVDENGDKVALVTNDYYGHFVLTYTNTNGETVKELTDITTDQAVLEEYDVIYDETFSATTNGLYVYYDTDLDGVADEVAEEDATLAKELIEKLWNAAKAEDAEKTIADNLTTVLRQYNLANSSSEWAKYKQAGLRIRVINNSSYTNSTSADENVLNLVHSMWTDIVNYKDEFGTTSSITGQSLDPSYRYIKNNKVFTVTAYQFADKYSAVYADSGYYKLAVVKATNRTSYEYSSSTRTQKPSLYYYEQYQLDSSDRDVTINCSSQITSYYKPAISRLSSTDVVNKALMEECKALLSSVTFAENNDQAKALLEKLIDTALAEYEE